MPDYPSFPELDAKLKPSQPLDYEDDTLETGMEFGYTTSRPRGSRARRIWGFQILPFSQSDFDKLDLFVRTTVRGAAGLFYFTIPNPDLARTERVLVKFVKGQHPKPAYFNLSNQVEGRILYTASFQVREP